jgi:hypothetical protein
VQLAHRHCNESKGCSVACPSLIDCIDPRDRIAGSCIDQTQHCAGVGRINKSPFFSQPHAACARIFDQLSQNGR